MHSDRPIERVHSESLVDLGIDPAKAALPIGAKYVVEAPAGPIETELAALLDDPTLRQALKKALTRQPAAAPVAANVRSKRRLAEGA